MNATATQKFLSSTGERLRWMPLRAAAVCGLLTLVTVTVAYMWGTLAQPDAYSSADDATSDLGALTANKAWIFNQIGANLTGILIILFGLGLWRALSPDVLGRIGAGAVMLTGLGFFVIGFFPLDCRGIDPGCTNDSWHSSAHKWDNRFLNAVLFAAPLILAFAFRRLPKWRDLWLPTLLFVPVSVAVGVLFSAIGDGASQRAGNVTVFLWLGLLAWWLLRLADGERSDRLDSALVKGGAK
jgi:Protein of unknown function (DUF998)